MVARSQEAYGILVDGTAVCTGYARAFQLLASAMGLTSVMVTGEADGGVTTDALPRRDYLLMNPRDPRMETRAANLYWVVDANAGMYA